MPQKATCGGFRISGSGGLVSCKTEVVHGSRYCDQPTCFELGCSTHPSAGYGWCVDHQRCSWTERYCSKKRVSHSSSRYCETHECNAYNCHRAVVPNGSRYCGDHLCIATTSAGNRCTSAVVLNGLCKWHYDQDQKAKQSSWWDNFFGGSGGDSHAGGSNAPASGPASTSPYYSAGSGRGPSATGGAGSGYATGPHNYGYSLGSKYYIGGPRAPAMRAFVAIPTNRAGLANGPVRKGKQPLSRSVPALRPQQHRPDVQMPSLEAGVWPAPRLRITATRT